MKNILLLVHDGDGQEARFQAALDMARSLDGHLICLDVALMPILVGDYGSGATAMLLAEEREHERLNKKHLEKRLQQEDVTWNWVDAMGSVSDTVVRASAMADIIVLNRRLDAFAYPNLHDATSSIIMHARKPILAVPDTLSGFRHGRALIAWDGRESVIATMRASIALLESASAIEIFTVGDPKERVDPSEAAEYLSRHGIHAEVREQEGTAPPDTLIAAESARWRADYILMGAYNRGRLMETFGGVTKNLLRNSQLPLVLGH